MHDPMVVAFEIPSPRPRRDKWREKADAKRWGRWGLCRSRRTNEKNRGEPTYPWWRPKGWTLRLAGRSYKLGTLATVWHVEPGERDAGTVCKWSGRWRWHVWHWHLQIHVLQDTRARLLDRCTECGRKGRPNVSHQWDGKRLGWRKFRSREGLFHMECSSLVHLRRTQATDEGLIRHLVAALRVQRDETEAETLAWLTRHEVTGIEFAHMYRLQKLLGYERDDDYKLVPAQPRGGRG